MDKQLIKFEKNVSKMLLDFEKRMKAKIEKMNMLDDKSLPEYISVSDVSKMYDVSTRKVLAYKDAIGYTKRAGKVYFLKEDLYHYMETGERRQNN